MNNELSVPELGKKNREERRILQAGNMPEYKLMLATPCYMSQEFSTYGDSMLETVRMLEAAGIKWQKQTVRGDSYLERAKNSILANFLESDCTDILMIDSDMEWSPDAVARMIKHPQSIVGGFFPMKNMWNNFCGALKPDEDGNIPDIKTAIELWDGSCLFKAHLMPGGFLRIKRDVLERFADHYPDAVYQDPCADPSKPDRVYTEFFACRVFDHIRYGEDATFSRMMREMGEDIYCDPNIHFGHHGVKGFYGNYNDSLLKSPEELDAILKEREGVKAVRFEPDAQS